MNRVHQKHKIYKPVIREHNTVFTNFGYYSSKANSGTNVLELVGTYIENKESYPYYYPANILIAINKEIINEEEKVFIFEGAHDVSVGSKIEIEGQEYVVSDKKYQLNGDIDYFIEDKYIECEEYSEKYKTVKDEAKQKLLEKRQAELKIIDKSTTPERNRKKSFWQCLGFK